jgi:tetratricopeptide (TPR) repeat protein
LEAIHEVQADDERTARGKAELLLRLEKLFLDTGDEPSAADVRLALSSVNRYLEPGLRLEAAERLVASGHHAEARNRFFELMCDHPAFIYGAERTEAFLSGIGENMEKVRFWREVTGCASEFSLPWIRLGLALEAQGATDEVEKAFSQAMQQGDGRDLAAIYLATTSSALDNPEDAAALLQNALNAHPERTPLAVQRAIAAAQGLIAEDKHEDALRLCASLLPYTENESSLRFDLAGALMDAHAYSDARAVYQALLSVPDFHEKVAVRLDEALLRQEAMAARRDYWKVLFQQYADSPEIRQRYAGALFDLGEWEGCVELLESLFRAGGLSGESRVRMGIALAASGRREEGRRLFWPQDAEPEEKRLQLSILLMQSARLLAEQGQFGTAAELAEESVHINPEQEEGWVFLGTMQEKNGDAEKTLQIWCAALEQLPQANRIASALHALLEQSRSPEERVEVWRQLREKSLDSSAVLIYYARALESVGRIEAALTAYQEGLAHENPPWDTMLRLGGAMIKLGRTEEGLKVVNDAVEKDESLKSLAAIVCFEAGDFLMEQDVVQSAIAAYQQSTLWNPQDLSIQMKLGNAYQRAQRFDSAAEVFEAIMAADAASSVAAQAALQWDAVLKQSKTLSQRASHWREMMQRLSAFPLPFEYGIPALVEANEMEEAIQICETMGGSLKTDAVAFICALLEFQQHPSETLWETIASGTVPFNPAPMPIINLVSIIGMRHLDAQQYDRAERLFRLAERLQPDNLWHQVRLGEALVMQQRYGDALERFRRVLRTVPESPYSADQVDRIYDMLDTPEERIREWRDLTALHPESKVLQQHLQQALQQTVHE